MQRPGDEIDIWIVEKALGSGGMGSVYRCHNRSANRILAAVKVLDPGLRRYPEAEARFIREAEILFSLDHPNIVKVRNIRTDVDTPYLEMEFVEGESLESRLARAPVRQPEALDVMAQCASALAYMHGKGVRHRDIKPANLLVQPDGVVKIVDFGLAMETEGARITQTGMAFGTVSYAPPEWITPEALDPAAWDIYALGVVFQELLTGQMAFPVGGEGSARQQAMQVIVGKQGHAPLDPGDTFHEDVRRLIRDMTQANPADRVSSMAKVDTRLRALRRQPLRDARVTFMSVSQPTPEELAETLPQTFSGLTPSEGDSDRRITPPSDSTRSRWGLVALGAVIGVLVFAGLVGAAYVAWRPGPGSTRDVQLEMTGELPYEVSISGQAPDEDEGRQALFRAQPVSDLEVAWVAGAGCTLEACPGPSCPTSCATGTMRIDRGATAATLKLPAPPLHSVELQLPNVTAGTPVAAQLGDFRAGQDDGTYRFMEVPPGVWPLRVKVGGCSSGEPQTGCAVHEAEVTVPWDAPVPPLVLEIEPPTPAAAAKPEPKPKPKAPSTVALAPPPSTGPRAGRRVSVGEFAVWLAGHPEWQIDATRGGLQGEGYLQGWSGATPPPDRSPAAAMNAASFGAARAYCRSRTGDLASMDALPGVTDSALEWRLGPNPDVPALLGNRDGEPERLTTGVPNVLTGTLFRCRK